MHARPRRSARNRFEQLRSLCEFWQDDRQHVVCCQFAEPEELEHEAESFDCENCPVAAHLDTLDADNRKAWEMAHVLCRRFLQEHHALGPVLVNFMHDLDEDDRLDLIRRLNLIYDVLVPKG